MDSFIVDTFCAQGRFTEQMITMLFNHKIKI